MGGYLDKQGMALILSGDEKGPARETLDGIADPRPVVRRPFAIGQVSHLRRQAVLGRRRPCNADSCRRYDGTSRPLRRSVTMSLSTAHLLFCIPVLAEIVGEQ